MLGDLANRVPGMYLLATDDIFRCLEKVTIIFISKIELIIIIKKFQINT